jgi:hypothetical protein
LDTVVGGNAAAVQDTMLSIWSFSQAIKEPALIA